MGHVHSHVTGAGLEWAITQEHIAFLRPADVKLLLKTVTLIKCVIFFFAGDLLMFYVDQQSFVLDGYK